MKKSMMKRIAGGLFAAALAVTAVFGPAAELGEAPEVQAASAHWELQSKGAYRMAPTWKMADFVDPYGTGTAPCSFKVNLTHHGIASDLSSKYTEKGSGTSYQASTGYYNNMIDMDVTLGGPGRSISGGAKVTIPYNFIIRTNWSVHKSSGESAGESTGRLEIPTPRWETSEGSYGYLDPDKTGSSAIQTYHKSGKFSGNFPKGTKNGEKLTLVLKVGNTGAYTTGDNAFLMSSTFVYKWTTSSSSSSSSKSKKPGKVVITKIYNKNSVYPHGVKVVWKKLKKNVVGYQKQVSLTKSFKHPAATAEAKKTSNVWNIGTNKGQRVWVRIRAFNVVNGKRIYGPWSAVKNKKAK